MKGKAIVVLIRLGAILPMALYPLLGRLTASLLWYWPHGRARQVTLANLRVCFPDFSQKERDTLARQTMVEGVIGALDTCRCWLRPKAALGRIHRVSGELAALDQAVAQGRPIVMLAPHLGCWEVANHWVGQRHALHALFKPSPHAEVDALIRRSREHFGSTLYPTTRKGLVGLVRALRQGAITAILPDQVPHRSQGGQLAPFFGRPAMTATLAPRLIQESGALVLVLYALRRPGNTYELMLNKPDPRVYAQELSEIMAGINASVEAAIREAPTQYTWSYKRFRRKPPPGWERVYARKKRSGKKKKSRQRPG